MQSIRIMTWNLWGQHGPWRERQEEIIKSLRSSAADIIGLQEAWVDSEGITQAQILADSLRFDFHFSVIGTPGSVRIGNAILSRWPLEKKGQAILPAEANRDDERTVIHACVDSPVGLIPALTTHLSWQRNASRLRLRQVSAIQEIASNSASSKWPPLLFGDFNADPCSDEIRMLTGRYAGPPDRMVFQDAWEQGGDGSSGYTWTPNNSHFEFSRSNRLTAMPWLRRRIDYIFIGLPDSQNADILPIQIQRAWLAGQNKNGGPDGSDHYAVVADCTPLYIL